MAEPLAAVIRNSLLPVRFAIQSTSSAVASVGGAMHHQQQLSFFSPNYFGPLPRRTKGKEKEREEPRLRRVLQCKEWSCCATRNFLYCPAHGLPSMLRELLPPQERSVRRFQNLRAQLTNHHPRPPPFRLRGSPGTQQRHTSHTALEVQTRPQSNGQPEASTSKVASISTTQTDPISLTEALELVTRISDCDKVALDDFSLEDAWKAFDVIFQNSHSLDASHDEHILLCFVERFCDKLELFYEEVDSFNLVKNHREQLRMMIEWLDGQLKDPTPDQFMAIQVLFSRSRATHGQNEAAIEILEKVRPPKRDAHPLIAKGYKSIYSSIFYYHDGIHVVDFLDRHFFNEYFRPPYCFLWRDRGITAPAILHPRLLHILSTIRDPISLASEHRSNNWPRIVTLLILAYCQYNLPQPALSLYKATPSRNDVHTPLLQLRLVRTLAQGGCFDEAYDIFSVVPRSTPEYLSTGAHLFALQGDYLTVRKHFAKMDGKRHHKAMLLLGLAVQGKTIKLRELFNHLFPRSESGKYVKLKPDVIDYAIAVHAHARRSNPEGIVYWMERMAEDEIQPNQYIYSSIVHSYLQSGNLGAVADVLNQMREAGVPPNAVIYTNVITALGRHHKPSTAEGVFKRALRENIKPDQAMVGALMNCYVEAGQWDEAVTLFRSLENNTRTPLHLTIQMYNIALKGYVIMGAPFRVVATLFEQLDADPNVIPTDVTFSLLLQSACESGYMRAAMDIFKEMDRRAQEGAKSLINPYVFTILMSGFLRKGNKDEALAVYQEMLNRGMQPTSVTHNTLLRYYSNERSAASLRMAYEFMTRIARREEDDPIVGEGNLRLSPTQLVFEPVLRGYATSGDVEGFERLLEEMLDAGGQVTVMTLSALMDLYRRKGRLDSATQVWEHLLELGDEAMQAARFPADGQEDIESRTDMLCVPLTIYLDTLSEAGEHENVLQTWQIYKQKGFSFNFFNWNRLGTYLIRAGEYERAFEVLDRIILPYIRITRNQPRDMSESPSTTVDVESKSEPAWKFPFEVLNKTNLSFLQSAILPIRPSTSSPRVNFIRRRSFRGYEDSVTALALQPPLAPAAPILSSQPPQSPPPSPSSSAAEDTTLPDRSLSISEEPEERNSSSPSPSTQLDPNTSTTPKPLDHSTLSKFIRPLYALSHATEGVSPRVHFSLLHHLLIGYQRLRAGQPAVPSTDPGNAFGDDYYYAENSPELEAKVKEQFNTIVEKYPDAIAAVVEFEQEEKKRLRDRYEKVYFWG